MSRPISRMPILAGALLACFVLPASLRADSSFVRVGPAADVAAVGALRGDPKTNTLGNVVVIGDTGYVEYGTKYVFGLQIFAKKINGKWQKVAAEGDDVASAAQLSAKSHGQLTPAQICALYHQIPSLGADNVTSTRDKFTPGCR